MRAMQVNLKSIDVVLHSAAVLGSGEVTDLAREDWRYMFELNVAVADLT